MLLPVLSRRRPLCACLLEASPSWAELCWAFAARRPQLAAGLAPKLQRWLSQVRAGRGGGLGGWVDEWRCAFGSCAMHEAVRYR